MTDAEAINAPSNATRSGPIPRLRRSWKTIRVSAIPPVTISVQPSPSVPLADTPRASMRAQVPSEPTTIAATLADAHTRKARLRSILGRPYDARGGSSRAGQAAAPPRFSSSSVRRRLFAQAPRASLVEAPVDG